MKNTKKMLTISLLAFVILCVALFAGCKKDDDKGSAATASASPKATATAQPTATAVATQSPTTAPATATPAAEKNLLDFAIEDEPSLLGGDTWTAIDDVWGGPLQEKRDGAENAALQELVEEELSDGTSGICYHFYSDSTLGYHIVGNTFGLGNVVSPNKTYKVTATLKYTVPNPGAEKDDMHIVYSGADKSTAVKVESKNEWQKVEYTFTTGADIDGTYLVIGPISLDGLSIMLGDIQAGFDLLIENINLVEVK